ncbi:hypothetical protein SAMN02910400_01046 [Lachnospiraceae bacterium C10]|nr:hypothetical protein SAMN02910400_01046 [Lachnospiraceae bacterium C10]
MTEMSRWLPWGMLFLFVFIFSGIVHKRFKERDVWHNIVKRYKENTDNRLLSEAEFVTRFGAMENNSILYKLDRLVLTSGVKNYLPWINGEAFLMGMIFAGLAGFMEGVLIFQNAFIAIFLTAAQAVAVYVFFKALSGKTYNEIEDATAIFISILSNHAKGSSDIVTIMDNTIPALSGPLRAIVQKFVSDAENTGNVDIAFDYMKESIDNRQLQTIIINLKNCMHYQANYEEVLVQMMGQIAAGLSAREDRKNILFSSKLTLVVISIMQVVIVWIIGAGLGIDVKEILTGNAFGQAILLVTGLLYLMVGVKMFGTDK